MVSVVVATPDVVGRRMAGPGIRAYHLARELARHFETTLIADLQDLDLDHQGFDVVQRGSRAASRAFGRANVVIAQPFRDVIDKASRNQRLVFDLFDPVVLELPELAPYRSRVRQAIHTRQEWGRLLFALRQGDLLICANRRQQDFYTGVRAAADPRRMVPADRWIEVPFGVEERMPEAVPEESQQSRPLVLWGGGIWPWLDPEAAVDAVVRLNGRGIDCRLQFLGTRRPNLEPGQLGGHERLRRLVAEAGDLVEWNDEWIPYRERDRWLGVASIAIMLHRRILEAEYSMRTRIFDAIWCGVPVITSAGGFAADLVAQEHLGVVVEPENPDSIADGLERLLTDDALRARSVFNLERVRQRYRWDVVTRPLIDAIAAWKQESRWENRSG